MLADNTVVATLAVSDMEAGKKFYGETLGLKQTREDQGGVEYTSGAGKLYVYVSETAGKNESTAAFWYVSDVKETVADLASKGITFEHYDFPWAKREGDVHVSEDGEAVAWFKDPDGNILGVGSNANK